jgi:hypothetical protein
MRETRSSGSVEGVMSNRDPYSDSRTRVSLFGHSAQLTTQRAESSKGQVRPRGPHWAELQDSPKGGEN